MRSRSRNPRSTASTRTGASTAENRPNSTATLPRLSGPNVRRVRDANRRAFHERVMSTPLCDFLGDAPMQRQILAICQTVVNPFRGPDKRLTHCAALLKLDAAAAGKLRVGERGQVCGYLEDLLGCKVQNFHEVPVGHRVAAVQS